MSEQISYATPMPARPSVHDTIYTTLLAVVTAFQLVGTMVMGVHDDPSHAAARRHTWIFQMIFAIEAMLSVRCYGAVDPTLVAAHAEVAHGGAEHFSAADVSVGDGPGDLWALEGGSGQDRLELHRHRVAARAFGNDTALRLTWSDGRALDRKFSASGDASPSGNTRGDRVVSAGGWSCDQDRLQPGTIFHWRAKAGWGRR